MRNRYLVRYDVSDPKRLRAVFKALKGYGDHLQYSVFRCDLTASQRQWLLGDLESLIHHREDRVMIVDIGPVGPGVEGRFQFLGRSIPPPSDEPVIV